MSIIDGINLAATYKSLLLFALFGRRLLKQKNSKDRKPATSRKAKKSETLNCELADVPWKGWHE